jgi:hypothetical protein
MFNLHVRLPFEVNAVRTVAGAFSLGGDGREGHFRRRRPPSYKHDSGIERVAILPSGVFHLPFRNAFRRLAAARRLFGGRERD